MSKLNQILLLLILSVFFDFALTGAECRWNYAGPLPSQTRTQCLNPFGTSREGVLSTKIWTHPPRCVSSKPFPRCASKPAYCLFTSAVFGGHRGLSIITTPEIAADAVASDVLEDLTDFWAPEDRLITPGPISNFYGPSYTVENIPGKGKGVVARRRIVKGEVFMLDQPALLAHRGFLDSLGPDRRQAFLVAAIEQLPETPKEQIMTLARSSADDKSYAEDVLTTNACGVFLGDTESHMGLFPEVSRINHACNASAFFRFSQRTLGMEVIAYRDILRGEEISINYAYLGMPFDVRQQFLQDTWGFRCSCSMCSLSPTVRETSDKRRMEIVKSGSEMQDAERLGDIDRAIISAERLLKLSEAEGLAPLMARFHQTLAQLHLDAGDVSLSKRHNQEALELWLQFHGEDSFQVASNHRFMRDIKRAEARIAQGTPQAHGAK